MFYLLSLVYITNIKPFKYCSDHSCPNSCHWWFVHVGNQPMWEVPTTHISHVGIFLQIRYETVTRLTIFFQFVFCDSIINAKKYLLNYSPWSPRFQIYLSKLRALLALAWSNSIGIWLTPEFHIFWNRRFQVKGWQNIAAQTHIM